MKGFRVFVFWVVIAVVIGLASPSNAAPKHKDRAGSSKRCAVGVNCHDDYYGPVRKAKAPDRDPVTLQDVGEDMAKEGPPPQSIPWFYVVIASGFAAVVAYLSGKRSGVNEVTPTLHEDYCLPVPDYIPDNPRLNFKLLGLNEGRPADSDPDDKKPAFKIEPTGGQVQHKFQPAPAAAPGVMSPAARATEQLLNPPEHSQTRLTGIRFWGDDPEHDQDDPLNCFSPSESFSSVTTAPDSASVGDPPAVPVKETTVVH